MALELKTDEDVSPVKDSDLVPGGDEETVYQVRHMSVPKHREIVRQNTKRVPNRRTHQFDEMTDWEAVGDDLIDYALTDWSGVVANGAPLPCTREYKLRLDSLRRAALLERAGMNEIAAAPERRAESFRPPA